MKVPVPLVLSLNAGYVDTAGFLALQGLFTAHVTGNFVTFGAAAVHGASGAFGKLLALPTFCLVIVATRLVSYGLPRLGLPVFRTMITLKMLLLAAAAIVAVRFGPFPNADSPIALAMGMTLVAAMAIQNAAHRIHLSKAPPTTLMTGNSTQIMLDLADCIRGVDPVARTVIRNRLKSLAGSVIAFAIGCAAAAGGYVWFGMWCFSVPPAVALVTVFGLAERAAWER